MGDWQERANKRRDERHTKIDDAPATRSKKSKKNTKLWCKGVVGREHETSCFKKPQCIGYYVLKCNNCGKELDYYFTDSPFDKRPRPDWLIEEE
jgi:hypothetical protein